MYLDDILIMAISPVGGAGAHYSSDLPLGESRLHNQYGQIHDPALPTGGVLGHDPGLCKNGDQDPGREDKKDKRGCKEGSIDLEPNSEGALSPARENDCHVSSSSPSASVLQTLPEGPVCSTRERPSVIRLPLPSFSRKLGRAGMVEDPHRAMECMGRTYFSANQT